ncbi:MAG: isoprenylcysteine carboxylmethyltransferase family protein [Saprospiraceae bacterium]|nr:isoprenylcysteine carboxylmethyltransferase family protein [Saprospiraceae bacterium]
MLIFLFLYFGVIIGLRTYLLYKQTRVNAVNRFNAEIKSIPNNRNLILLLVLMIVIALNFIFLDNNYLYFIPFHLLAIPWLQTFGFIIAILGLATSFIGQLQMRGSWRLSTDANRSAVGLITDGLFKYSRNPIYLGLIIAFFGFFLIAPNLGSLLFLLSMLLVLYRKIISEEAFLSQKVGDYYDNYASRTKRWL